MNQIGQLRRRTGVRGQAKAVRLGDALAHLMAVCDAQPASARQTSPQPTAGRLPELWADLLPPELAKHTRLTGVSQGRLKVEVDSPAYLYELHLCAAELVRHLSHICPGARITSLKPVIAPVPFARPEETQHV